MIAQQQPKADLNQRKCVIRSSPSNEPHDFIAVRYSKETMVCWSLILEPLALF
jgi:hypothetical protein